MEPLVLGSISATGTGLSLVLAQSATTPAEYGSIFLAFLLFLGLGVLSIAGYAAHKIVTTAIDAFTKFAGDQAAKLEALPTAGQLDERLGKESERRNVTEAAIVATLNEVKGGLAEITAVNRLLKQSIDQHEKRLDQQFELIQGKSA